MEKAKRKKNKGEEWGHGRSFWLRRPRRIHGRTSFSKVSARTKMPLVDSRMGTERINDRDHNRLPKELLPFVPSRFFLPLKGQWKSGRKYLCSITLKIIVTFVDIHVHDILSLPIYRMNKRKHGALFYNMWLQQNECLKLNYILIILFLK